MSEEKITLIQLQRIEKLFWGTGFVYVKALTEEDEVISGVRFKLFGLTILTFALADALWVDKNDEPYQFKLDGNVLFIKRFAISFGAPTD